MISQTLAKGFTLRRPSNRFLKADSRIGLHGGGHAHPFTVEVRHDDLEAFILCTDEVVDRHTDFVKVEGGGI